MATTIFENIIDGNLGGKIPSKGVSSVQKSDSFKFRELVRSTKVDDSRSEAKVKDEHNSTTEAISAKQANNTKEQVAEETSTETVVSVDQTHVNQEAVTTLPVVEREITLVVEAEEDIVPEEELEQQEEEIIHISAIGLSKEQDDEIELPDLISNDPANNKVAEENVVVPIALPEITKVINSSNVNKGTTVTTNEVVSESIDIAELPAEDQAMHQSLKTFDLPSGFAPDDVSRDVELLTDKPQITPQSDGIKQLEELSSKLEAPVKLIIDENVSGKNIVESAKPIMVTPSLNLALADTTRHGKNIISRMQTPASDQSASVVSEGEEFVLDNEAILSNLGDKDNSSAGQRSLSSLETFGAVIERANDETFEITFKGQDFGSRRSEMPKPAMQVSLAVSEVLNSSSASGQKQITINLHPQTLGAVKVEILSQVGHDGASKVESIKISADKHETLVMLEERRAELAKSLKEVNGAEEKEASLQFEMSQDQGKGQGAYFTSLEERNNWMSKFVGLVADDELQTGNTSPEVDEYATRGIITEDKVDLVA